MEYSIYYPFYLKFIGKNLYNFGTPHISFMVFDTILTVIFVSLLFYLFKFLFGKIINKNLKKRLKQFYRKELVIILFLFLFSFLLRLAFINDGLFHHDSVQLAKAVQKTIDTGKVHSAVGGREGFVIVNSLLFPFLKNILRTQSNDFILNLITVLFSSLSIIFVYLFTKELLENKAAAFFSSIMFSLAPVFLSVTTYVKSHGMAVFFAICSGYLLIKGIKTNKVYYKLGFGFLFGFSLFVRITNAFYLIPFLILYFFSVKIIDKKFEFYKGPLYDLGLYLFPLVIMVILLVFVEYPTIVAQISANKIPINLQEIFRQLLLSFIYLLKSITWLGFLLVLMCFLVFLKKKEYAKIGFYLAWIVIPFLYFGSLKTTSPRFLIPILLPLIMLMSLAIIYIWKEYPDLSKILLITVLMIMVLSIYPIIKLRHEFSSPKEYALFIKNNTEDNAFIIARDDVIFLQHYTQRATIGHPLKLFEQQKGYMLASVIDSLNNKTPVYVGTKMLTLAGNILNRTLHPNFDLEYIDSIYVEDYHHSSVTLNLNKEELFRIKRKGD